VLGELKDVLIRLSSNAKVHQTIDIIVVDILKSYGMLLSRDWSEKLNVYFSIDRSHIWLPYNGQPNKIKVDREHHIKHTVTYLNDPNEPIMFNNCILGNYCFDSFFGNFHCKTSPFVESCLQSKILHCTRLLKQIVLY
jgi:hypothetical protein